MSTLNNHQNQSANRATRRAGVKPQAAIVQPSKLALALTYRCAEAAWLWRTRDWRKASAPL